VDRDVPGAIRRRQGRRRPPKSVPFLLICVYPCASVVPLFSCAMIGNVTKDENRSTRMDWGRMMRMPLKQWRAHGESNPATRMKSRVQEGPIPCTHNCCNSIGLRNLNTFLQLSPGKTPFISRSVRSFPIMPGWARHEAGLRNGRIVRHRIAPRRLGNANPTHREAFAIR
jgi:hypothetical protein